MHYYGPLNPNKYANEDARHCGWNILQEEHLEQQRPGELGHLLGQLESEATGQVARTEDYVAMMYTDARQVAKKWGKTKKNKTKREIHIYIHTQVHTVSALYSFICI
jgi:hypothetical protein